MAEAGLLALECFKTREVLRGFGLDRRAHFDFDRMQHASVLDDEVDLAFLRISIEPAVAQVGSRIHIALQHLGHYESLERMTRHRTVSQLIGGGPAGGVVHQICVHEVELGCLGEAFANVGSERANKSDDSTRLQHGKPALHLLERSFVSLDRLDGIANHGLEFFRRAICAGRRGRSRDAGERC